MYWLSFKIVLDRGPNLDGALLRLRGVQSYPGVQTYDDDFIYLEYVWIIFGVCLDHTWSTFGYLGYVWTIFEVCLDNIWCIFGQYFEYMCAIFGVCLDYICYMASSGSLLCQSKCVFFFTHLRSCAFPFTQMYVYLLLFLFSCLPIYANVRLVTSI